MPADAREGTRRLLATLAQNVVEELAERGRSSTEEEIVELVLRGWNDVLQLDSAALRDEVRQMVRALVMRHLARDLSSALELALVGRAPNSIVDQLATAAGLLAALEQLPLDTEPLRAWAVDAVAARRACGVDVASLGRFQKGDCVTATRH